MSTSNEALFPLSSTAERVADAVLYAGGGRPVRLRVPVKAGTGDADQLGLATPRFQDVPLGPAAFRRTGSEKVLLLSASSLRRALSATGADSVKTLLQTATGVLVDNNLYGIEAVTAMGSLGQPYCWALSLAAPQV